jgi:integrase
MPEPECRLHPTWWVLLPGGNNPHSYPHRSNETRVRGNARWVREMSIRHHRGGWETRWRDTEGRNRSKRFKSEEAARVYDEAMRDVSPTARRSEAGRGTPGVYSYRTREGIRWRFVVRRSDGSQTSKRGFGSQRVAAEARRRFVEQVERREVVHTTETFGHYWDRWLARRRPYLEDGTWTGYEINGRKRLLPMFANTRLGVLSVDDVRAFVAEQAEAVEAGEIAAKTVNNALVTLVVCLNDAVDDGLLAANPALRVDRLPAAHIERDYLRLHEIPIYLDSCSDVYRPLADALIGSGVRISEALALRVGDLELDNTGGVIVVYRSRKKGTVGSTKSDRFRSVEIGPRTSLALRNQISRRREFDTDLPDHALVFVMPVRGRKRTKGRWESAGVAEAMDRTTVSRDWHKQALLDAALRDMPLHALRHTAAASWLAAGNSLMYVQRQLGHADIGTTERYYGHLERHVLAAGAIATEEAIARAVKQH